MGKKTNEYECRGYGRIATPAGRIEIDGIQYPITTPPNGLVGYESGTIMVNNAGELVFRPDATPDTVYTVGRFGERAAGKIDPHTGNVRQIDTSLFLADVLVNEKDPDAWLVANRREQ